MRVFLVVLFVFFSTYLSAQQIPANRVVEVNELGNFLKEDVANQILQNGGLDESKLASYFREKFSERFFYDYRTFEDRLLQYNQVYRNGEAHQKRALDHIPPEELATKSSPVGKRAPTFVPAVKNYIQIVTEKH